MNAVTLLHQDAHSGAKPHTTARGPLEGLEAWGAFIGLGGGFTSALLGSLLTVAGWLTADAGARHWLATAGTVLLCSTIPLIVLGAYCLDWLEKDETQSGSQTGPYDNDDDEL